ncbi:MAG: hypothetical protein KC441_01115 [Anaerolineales bacterium]|nr:hypothetical protein [Anaerolineales bacterium]
MNNMCTYRVAVKGQIDASDLSASSPLEMVLVSTTPAATSFTLCTDQSGMIGMLRYLHGRGFILLSLSRGEQR